MTLAKPKKFRPWQTPNHAPKAPKFALDFGEKNHSGEAGENGQEQHQGGSWRGMEAQQPTQAESTSKTLNPQRRVVARSGDDGGGESCKLEEGKGKNAFIQSQSDSRRRLPSPLLGVSWFAPGLTHKRIGLYGHAPGGSGRPIVALARQSQQQSKAFVSPHCRHTSSPSSPPPSFTQSRLPRGVNFLTVALPSLQKVPPLLLLPFVLGQHGQRSANGCALRGCH